MISLRKDPKGENVFDKGNTLTSVEIEESSLRKTIDPDIVTALTERIKELETGLNTYKVIMTVISMKSTYSFLLKSYMNPVHYT